MSGWIIEYQQFGIWHRKKPASHPLNLAIMTKSVQYSGMPKPRKHSKYGRYKSYAEYSANVVVKPALALIDFLKSL